jgi:ABC-type sugar transport system ATPase subunit
MATEIRLENLRCQFGRLAAVDNISITFPASSVTCLLGPSGCGKTTLMRMLAGLQTPTSGDIYFGEQRVTDLSPSERNVGMVFQYPVVYRGTTLYRSVELPLIRDRHVSKSERKQRVESILDMLDLTPLAGRDVSSLDNATRQKAAVARAVARQPQIILFDEPITNVDVNAKSQLKRALKTLVKQHSQTIIYVTHDQTEAMTLADEIALMENGRIVQRGIPRELYNHPNTRFGGWFLGNPGMNFVAHDIQHSDGRAAVAAPLFAQPIRLNGSINLEHVIVGIRPEQVRLGVKTPTSVQGEIMRTAFVVGGQQLVTLKMGEVLLKAKTHATHVLTRGALIDVDCPLQAVTLFADNGERLDVTLKPDPVEQSL